MQSDTKIIKKHFQKSIDKYADNADAQKYTADILIKELPVTDFDNILEIGAGAGILTYFAANTLKWNNYYANDLVEKSEIFVKKYIKDTKFFAGDFRKIKFNKKFDLIISNAVFQWFENTDKILDKCKNLLTKDGLLAFSTFTPNNFKEIRELTGLSLNYKSADDIKNVIEKDFDLISIKSSEFIMNFDNPLKILAHMKNTGVNSLTETHWGIKEVKNFCDKYSEKFPDLTLTYSPIIVVAKIK